MFEIYLGWVLVLGCGVCFLFCVIGVWYYWFDFGCGLFCDCFGY